jgi:hypothetical protein
MSASDRSLAISLWQKKWDSFIAKIRNDMACKIDVTSLPIPQIDLIFPRNVPAIDDVTITVSNGYLHRHGYHSFKSSWYMICLDRYLAMDLRVVYVTTLCVM